MTTTAAEPAASIRTPTTSPLGVAPKQFASSEYTLLLRFRAARQVNGAGIGNAIRTVGKNGPFPLEDW
jgi:hypothetical protein